MAESHGDPRPDEKRPRRAATAVIVILVLLIAFNVGETLWELRSIQQEYDPLGDFPEQEVLNKDNKVRSDEFVVVAGTKCNDSDHDVVIAGELRWRSVEPSGTSFTVFAGVGDLPPGCNTEVFHNPVPEQVADLAEQGLAMWEINGTNWPIDEDGNRGRPRDFTTETIEVVPE